MKKVLLPIIFMIMCVSSFAQNFEFSKTDSIPMKKDEIYSKTKMFITDTWKSSKAVIENDDKEGGIIQLKGIYKTKGVFTLAGNYYYIYGYTVRIRMKDNKYKVEIYDVICKDVACTASGRTGILIQPFEGDGKDVKTSNFFGGISKKKAIEMMAELKGDLNSIIIAYSDCISKQTKTDNF